MGSDSVCVDSADLIVYLSSGKEVFNTVTTLITGSSDSQARLNCLKEEIEACLMRPGCIDNGAKRTYLTKLIHSILNTSRENDNPLSRRYLKNR